jgi:hypothetical protein
MTRTQRMAISIRLALGLAALLAGATYAPKSSALHVPLVAALFVAGAGMIVVWALLGAQLLIWGRDSPVLRAPTLTAMPWSGALNMLHTCGWSAIGSVAGMLMRHVVGGDVDMTLVTLSASGSISLLAGVGTFSSVIRRR